MNGVQANVPFDFTVGSKLLPAGTYKIRAESERLIKIENHDKPIAILSLVTADDKLQDARLNGSSQTFVATR